MMLSPISSILGAVAGAAVASGIVYVGMLAHTQNAVSAAVRGEALRQRGACDVRVSEIARQTNDAISEGVRAALLAESTVSETPETELEIKKLCEKSASCRERGQ